MHAFRWFEGVDVWHVVGWTMLHYLWLGTLVGLAAGACRLVLRRAPANVRYVAALVCLAVLAALPVAIAAWAGAKPQAALVAESLSLALPAEFGPSAPSSAGGQTGAAHENGPIEIAPVNNIEANLVPDPGENPRQSRGLSHIIASIAGYLPWLWLIGTPLTFLLLATGIVGAERFRRASRVIDDGPIAEACARLVESLRIGRRVTVAICERIAAPVLVGIVRPIILLPPAALTGWSPDDIEMVLLHELAHVRRWDNLVNLAQRIIESLLFFHPAVWLVSNWVRRERESCCDAVVVRHTHRPQDYAELLINLAAHLSEPSEPGRPRPPSKALRRGRGRPGSLVSSAMAAGPLRSRIRLILQLEDDPMLVSGKSLALVMSGLLLTAMLVVLNLPTRTLAEEKELTKKSTEYTEQEISVAESQAATQNNLKDLMLGLLNYESANKQFPAQAKFDATGKPLLSWRVLLLPYLDPDHAKLYEKFHLDEPWDSDHNRKLITEMPKEFKNPRINRPGFTNYLAVVGGDCMFDGTAKGIRLAQVTDGTSHTIMLVEADESVEWTKPDDLDFHSERPREGVGILRPNGWYAAFADGSVKRISSNEPADQVREYFTRGGTNITTTENTESKPADNWPAGVVFPSPKEGEISRRAWKQLGVKLVYESNMRIGNHPSSSSVKVVGGAPLTPGVEEPLILKSVGGRSVSNFDELGMALEALTGKSGPIYVVTDHGKGSHIFVAISPARGQAEESATEVTENPETTDEASASEDKPVASKATVDRFEANLDKRRSPAEMLNDQIRKNVEDMLSEPSATNNQSTSATRPHPFPSLEDQKFTEVPFVVGASRFKNGDKIEILEVRGTAETIKPGNIYWIKGTYTLRSHDRAMLAAYTTAMDAANGTSPSLSVQSTNVDRGEGTFTLFLPMSYRGWPHVSFYPTDGGEGFGGIYFGTGDSVLENWSEVYGSDDTRSAESHAKVGRGKFPSLEDQKLADLAWKRLGLELEPIGEEDLKRVQALGYEGGLKVVTGAAGMNGGVIQAGDILVGLHVWPTTSLMDLAEVLNRDDLAELNPLKFYAIHAFAVTADGARVGGGGFGAKTELKDTIVTGRISVNVTDRRTSQATPTKPRPLVAVNAMQNNPFSASTSSDKQTLRYDGKTFDEWRTAWQTELSLEKRLEVVKALAAFGANGYATQAAESIVDVAGQYDWKLWNYTSEQNDNPLQLLLAYCVDAFSARYGLVASRMPEQEALTVLLAVADSTNPRTRAFVVRVLDEYRYDPRVAAALIKLSRDDDQLVRSSAFKNLGRGWLQQPDEVSQPILERLQEAMRADDPELQASAMQALISDSNYSQGTPRLRFVPEIEPLLFSKNAEIRKFARRAVSLITPNDSPQVVDWLVERLADPQSPNRLDVIRALGMMRSNASVATPELKKIFESSPDWQQRVASALAIDRIENGSKNVSVLMTSINDSRDEDEQRRLMEIFNSEVSLQRK